MNNKESHINESRLHHENCILSLLQSSDVLTFDQVIDKLPELSWSEVFHAVDALSRRGSILLRRRGCEYELAQSKGDRDAA